MLIKIFTLKMAKYLIKRGFYCKNVRPNPDKPWFNIYEFEDTPDLRAAMTEYSSKL